MELCYKPKGLTEKSETSNGKILTDVSMKHYAPVVTMSKNIILV